MWTWFLRFMAIAGSFTAWCMVAPTKPAFTSADFDMGTTTTPFDMVVMNKMSRFHLAIDALKHVPRLRSQASDAIDMFNRKLYEHHAYIREHFQDMPEIRNWHWTKDFSEPSAPPPLAKDQPRGQSFSDA